MREYVIGADNAGFALKVVLLGFMQQEGLHVEDVGVLDKGDNTPYPEVAKRLVNVIQQSNYKKNGVLICGTGLGMAIVANKFAGIYAAPCHDIFSAERARLSNNANILTMGERVIGPELAKKILKEWLSLKFIPGPSSEKLRLIKELEHANFIES